MSKPLSSLISRLAYRYGHSIKTALAGNDQMEMARIFRSETDETLRVLLWNRITDPKIRLDLSGQSDRRMDIHSLLEQRNSSSFAQKGSEIVAKPLPDHIVKGYSTLSEAVHSKLGMSIEGFFCLTENCEFLSPDQLLKRLDLFTGWMFSSQNISESDCQNMLDRIVNSWLSGSEQLDIRLAVDFAVIKPVLTVRMNSDSITARFWACPICGILHRREELSGAKTPVTICRNCGHEIYAEHVNSGFQDSIYSPVVCTECSRSLDPGELLLARCRICRHI
ncbi:MAG: hypothetical protein PHQ23_08560 [Candidatus Wallbacteria bacterium]|nr:hypothetical protein [Candidatus Wallbacteria bacterium]